MRILVACLFFTLATSVYQYNTHTISGPISELETDSRLFNTQVNSVLSRVRLVSNNLVNLLPYLDWENKSKSELQLLLEKRIEILQYVSIIVLFDKNGVEKAISLKSEHSPINIIDREYYHRAEESSTSFWTGPIKNKIDGSLSYLHITPIRKHEKFNGLLVAAITLDQFDTICSQSLLHTTRAVLSKTSGEVLAGCGLDTTVMVRSQTKYSELFPYLATTYTTKGVFRKGDYLYIVTKLKENSDLVVVAASPLKEYWLELYQHIVTELIIFVIALLVLLVPVNTRFRNT